MNQFDSIQEITSRLNELASQLTHTKLSKEELSEFENLSRQVFERAVILSYKAKEESVYGKSAQTEVKELVSALAPEVEESNAVELVEEIEESPEPIANAGEIQFDFSGGFDAPVAPKEVVKVEEAEIPTPIPTPAPIVEEKIEKPAAVEEKSQLQEILSGGNSDKSQSFYAHFSSAYQEAVKDKLSHLKIRSLKGAFGLNDRLLFIRELFNNNSDEFNTIVEELDQLEGSEPALRKLSMLAAHKSWNKEDAAVKDFVNMVNRRYVD